MPLDKYERQYLENRLPGAPPPVENSLNIALKVNPDKHAENLYLAEAQQVPVETVEFHKDEYQFQQAWDELDVPTLKEQYPYTSDYLRDPDNAAVSHDDLPALKGIEEWATQSWWQNTLSDIGIDLVKGTIGLGESAVGLADLFTFNLMGHAVEALGADPEAWKEGLSEYYTADRKDVKNW